MKTKDIPLLLYTVLLWGGAILGLVLFVDMPVEWLHYTLAAVAFLVLVLTATAWHSKAARVVARSLCVLLPLLFLAAWGTYAVCFYLPVVRSGGVVDLIIQPHILLSFLGAPLCCWLLPAAAVVARKGGRCDGWAAQLLHTAQAALACYCCYGAPAAHIGWHWDSLLWQDLWVILSVGGCLLGWVRLYRSRKKKTDEAEAPSA